ncbi:ABC transporter permease [Devosia sp. Root413D1]|uniref:ABC transporter permease n=1 Tax=Devosia sp. Root413D1 TaxID=1736531 RepID=UPI0006F2BF67|nr:ABC transporter permease [Devosia sp. Root413D1]KQW83523.1 ABC transporter permease [Devosia sp. Root413D1]
MLLLILKRLGNAVIVLLAVALLAFTIFKFLGDPVQLMLNPQATQEERDMLTERLGLNDPVPLQFAKFVFNAVQGEFGMSYRNQLPVMQVIAERFPATLELVLVSTIAALLIGLPLGVFAAIKGGTVLARIAHLVSMIGVSVPAFVIGIVLILVFSIELKVLPAFGRGEVVDLGYWTTGFLTASGRAALVMPAISLALFQISFIMRLVTSEMLEVLRIDFIRFARARGLKARAIYFRHALRNCLMPVVTITGMLFGDLIAFTLVTEIVFQWPGMGFLFVQSVQYVDIPVMAAYLMIVCCIFILINLIVDLIYVVVDPRVDQLVRGGSNGR